LTEVSVLALTIKPECCTFDTEGMTVPADEGFDFFATSSAQSADPATPETPAVPGRLGFTPQSQPGTPLPTGRQSRWAKSDTTFGPVGRLVATIALIVPFTFLVAAGLLTFDPFVFGGAGIWGALMVVGLRQTWAVVQHHHRR
jgi:hypothetical protein